jgi:hypothetical protein
MIIGFAGTPGSGKTYEAVKKILELGGPVCTACFIEGQGTAPGRSNADGRSPAHHHGLQCVNNIVCSAANYVRLLLWQNALVKQVQRKILPVKANMIFHGLPPQDSRYLSRIHNYALKAKRSWRHFAVNHIKNMPPQGVLRPAMLYKQARGWLCCGLTKSFPARCERPVNARASCGAARQGGVHACMVRA